MSCNVFLYLIFIFYSINLNKCCLSYLDLLHTPSSSSRGRWRVLVGSRERVPLTLCSLLTGATLLVSRPHNPWTRPQSANPLPSLQKHRWVFIHLSIFIYAFMPYNIKKGCCPLVAGHYPAVQIQFPAHFSRVGYTARTLPSSPGWKGASPAAYLPGNGQWQEPQTSPDQEATPSHLTLAPGLGQRFLMILQQEGRVCNLQYCAHLSKFLHSVSHSDDLSFVME